MRKCYSWPFLSCVFVTLIFIALGSVAFAQPQNPSGDPDVPITGIEILLAAGALFGAKKLLSRGRKSE